MERYELKLNDRAFNAIIARTKRIEIRANTNTSKHDYSAFKENDEIIFINSMNDKILCRITDINWYKDIETLLTLEGTRYTLSSTNDFNEGIKSINSLSGYEEGIKKNGVYAIHIEYINKLQK
jgi:ASC-1-like (ASCH) protein